MKKTRNNIRTWLIDLANWIGGGQHFMFGEPIVAMVTTKRGVVICTKRQLFLYDGKKARTIKTIK